MKQHDNREHSLVTHSNLFAAFKRTLYKNSIVPTDVRIEYLYNEMSMICSPIGNWEPELMIMWQAVAYGQATIPRAI